MRTIFLFIIIFTYSQTVNSQNSVFVEPAFGMLAKYQKIRDFTMTSSGNEAYFTIQSPLEEVAVIAMIKRENKI